LGLFRRKPQKTEGGFTWGPIRMEAAAFMEAPEPDSPWMQSGEFDLRSFLGELWNSGFLTTADVLRAVGQSDEDFWHGTNWDDQWDGGNQQEREGAFTTAMQFQNALDGAEFENGGPDPQVLALHATMRLKALLLATGIDATYGTDYLQRIVVDPAQFGAHDFS
jgi:hypothetical protein